MKKWHPHIGQGPFEWVETTPGRMDPRTGRFVRPTAVPGRERRGPFEWVEVTPGRVDPRTGRFIEPTARRGGRPRAQVERPETIERFQRERLPRRDLAVRPRFRVEDESDEFAENGETALSGRGRGKSDTFGTVGWTFVIGFTIFALLEATGVTRITKTS